MIRTKKDLEFLLGVGFLRLSTNGSSTWCITAELEDGSYYGFVTSPQCPQGQWRLIPRHELDEAG